jgi:hypothetical protein
MFGLSPRTATRLLAPPVLVLLTAVGTTGCAVPITGTAAPAPVVVSAPTPHGGTTPDFRWERVTDPGSGDSAPLPGPVQDTAYEDDGRAYSSRNPPGGLTLVSMQIQPVARGPLDLAALEDSVGAGIGGKPTASREAAVQGNPGLAARYAVDHAGQPSLALVQFISRPGYVLALLVVAPTARAAAAEDTIQTMVAGLRLGAPVP